MCKSFESGYALIVGVGADLPNTVDDARGLAGILKDPERCAYPPDQVELLTSEAAGRSGILAGLDRIAQRADEKSTVVIYFSGHGYHVSSSIGDAYYLMPFGYNIDQLKDTAISGTEFADRLKAIKAQKLLLLLDCCHAAPLPPEAQSLFAQGRGRVVIASSQADELSFAGKPYSAFTLALIDALCGAGASRKDGYVRVIDLALHTREMVPKKTNDRQHPIMDFSQMDFSQADNFVLAYYAGGEKEPKGLPFAEEPQIEPQPGAWSRGRMFDQRRQIVHGPQTNIAGNVSGSIFYVSGSIFSGQFNGPEECFRHPEIPLYRKNWPTPPNKWIGREYIINSISEDWSGLEKHVVGLIGFGGEGKSSLAYRWVGELLKNNLQSKPDGIFWWGFDDTPNDVDNFLENALNFLTKGDPPACTLVDSNKRIQAIHDKLCNGRYVFVLDQLEVFQHLNGDQHGYLKNSDIKALLESFCAMDHRSFCLLTSRAPMTELENFSTYKQRDVDRLTLEEGRGLLHNYGIVGDDSELDELVARWNGHALTLSLMAPLLRDCCSGNVDQVKWILPSSTKSRYEALYKVLDCYKAVLDEKEIALMILFSAFRTWIDKKAFEHFFFEQDNTILKINHISLNKFEFYEKINHLKSCGLIRDDSLSENYTIHPIIRTYFHELLGSWNPDHIKAIHTQIKNFYLSKAHMLDEPNLSNLKPFIEAVHHSCRSEDYDDAFIIHQDRIMRGEKLYLLNNLCAWRTEIEILSDFFPQNDTDRDPLVCNLEKKWWILHNMGRCQSKLGNLMEAKNFYERSIEAASKSLRLKKEEAKSRLGLGWVYRFRGNYKKEYEEYKKSLKIYNEMQYDAGRVETYFALGWYHADKKENEMALYYFTKSCSLAKKLNLNSIIIKNTHEIIRCNKHIKKDYIKSIGNYLDLLGKMGDDNPQKGWTLFEIGDCFIYLGDYKHLRYYECSYIFFKQAWEIFKATYNTEGMIWYHYGIADCSLHKGISLQKNAKVKEAEIQLNIAKENFIKALESGRKGGYKKIEAWSNYQLGRVYQAKECFGNAIKCFENSAMLFEEISPKDEVYPKNRISELKKFLKQRL